MGDLEKVARHVYEAMEAEAEAAEIRPWPRWNRTQIVQEAVQTVAFSASKP